MRLCPAMRWWVRASSANTPAEGTKRLFALTQKGREIPQQKHRDQRRRQDDEHREDFFAPVQVRIPRHELASGTKAYRSLERSRGTTALNPRKDNGQYRRSV